MSTKQPNTLEQIVGYSFQNQDLLSEALTHSSTGTVKNYERLEFLGDRVLGLVIAHLLFKKFPNEAEGDMAKRLSSLVQGTMIAQIALQIKLGDYIYFSDAERLAGGGTNENILADVFEALIGAIYLDGGIEPCEALISSFWGDILSTMITPPQHPKTGLQEWAQRKGLPLPEYTISEQHGPDHAPVFDIILSLKGYPDVVAQGKTRQEAEKQAASHFLERELNE